MKLCWAKYNQPVNEIDICVYPEGEFSIPGEKVTDDIFWVYYRLDEVCVIYWNGYKLEKMELNYVEHIVNKI